MFKVFAILVVMFSSLVITPLNAETINPETDKMVMKATQQCFALFLAKALDEGLTHNELIEFGDEVYSWDTVYYNAALHIIAWYTKQEDSYERRAMLYLGAYLEGRWQEEKRTRRRKILRIWVKGAVGVANATVIGFFAGGSAGAVAGGVGGALVGSVAGIAGGAYVGHCRTWKRISPELKSTIRLKPSKVIDESQNEELMELLALGPKFYKETKELVTYTIDQNQLVKELNKEVDFFGDIALIGQ